MRNEMRQLGEAPTVQEEAIKRATDSLQSITGFGTNDKQTISRAMTSNPIILVLLEQLNDLINAQEDFTNGYYTRFERFLATVAAKVDPDNQRERYVILWFLQAHFLNILKALIKEKRKKNTTTPDETITPEKMTEELDSRLGNFSALATDPSTSAEQGATRVPVESSTGNNAQSDPQLTAPPTNKTILFGVPALGGESQPTPAATQDATRSSVESSTGDDAQPDPQLTKPPTNKTMLFGVPALEESQPTPAPTQEATRASVESSTDNNAQSDPQLTKPPTNKTMLFGVPALEESQTRPTDDEGYAKRPSIRGGIPIHPEIEEAQEPVPTTSGEVALNQISFGETTPPPAPPAPERKPATNPGMPAIDSVKTPPPTPTIPPTTIQAETAEQTEQNTAPPEEAAIPIIVDSPPKEEDPPGNLYPIDVSQSLQNLQDLRAAVADRHTSLDKDFRLQGEIKQNMERALEEAIDTKSRRRVVHEIYEFIKSTNDPEKRKIIIQIFTNSLPKIPAFAQPVAPSERIQRAHTNSKTKAPKKASPSAFSQALQINEKEIEAMPAKIKGSDIRPSLQTLLIASQNLGLNHAATMTGSPTHRLIALQSNVFEEMCRKTLESLRIIDKKVGGRIKAPFGKRRRARLLIVKLKEILPAQMAVMDQLLFPTETK